MRLRTACLIALFLAACGKKGDPFPPVPIIPKAVTDLSVTQRGPEVILTWSYPSLTTAGKRLESIDSITVYRMREALVTVIDPAEIPPIPPPLFVSTAERLDILERQEIPGFVAGARIVYTDRPEVEAPDGRPYRYTYSVVTAGAEGRSAPSNLVSIVPLRVPSPPSQLIPSAAGENVELRWNAPTDAPVVGYNVYRFPPTGEITELGTPINPSPVTETNFSDTPPYGDHRYAVTSVASAGPPLIQSDPTPTVFIEFRDRLAPPPPASLVPLVEGMVVRMLWDVVETSDLAGYIVYRNVGDQRVKLTATPVTDANYRDDNPPRGVDVIYSVSSVDKAGNESGATAGTPVFIPR